MSKVLNCATFKQQLYWNGEGSVQVQDSMVSNVLNFSLRL